MNRFRFCLLLLLAAFLSGAALAAPATTLDVAPTTLMLKPGAAGLFYVTNHGARPVTVQIEAMDWHQAGGRDLLAPSDHLLASPPMATIAPGGRQSVRVLARTPDIHAFRLLVSQLPGPADDGDGVHVLLQFSVPVFVGRDEKAAPDVVWVLQGGELVAANTGAQAVKLEGLTVNGVLRGGLFYLLPGAARALGPAHVGAKVTAHESLSGRDLAATVADAHP